MKRFFYKAFSKLSNLFCKDIRLDVHSIKNEINFIKGKAGFAPLLLPKKDYRITDKIIVVFFVEIFAQFASLKTLYDIMKKNKKFLPMIIGIDIPGASKLGQEMISLYPESMIFRGDNPGLLIRQIIAINPDLIIKQHHWPALTDYPLYQQVESVFLNYKTAYINYESMQLLDHKHYSNVISLDRRPGEIISHFTNDLILDNLFLRMCWRVFCINSLILDMAKEVSPLEGEQFVVTGHPKYDTFLQEKPKWPILSDKRKFRVFWSAHHSIGNNGHIIGNFDIIHQDMLQFAIENPDIEIVFNPHPLLVRNTLFRDKDYSEVTPKYKHFIKKWNSLDNTYMLYNAINIPAMKDSDLCIADGISILAEYQIVGNPIIRIPRSDQKAIFNNIGKKVLEGVYEVKSFELAREMVLNFMENKISHTKHEIQMRNVQELYGESGAAQRIVDYIMNNIHQ